MTFEALLRRHGIKARFFASDVEFEYHGTIHQEDDDWIDTLDIQEAFLEPARSPYITFPGTTFSAEPHLLTDEHLDELLAETKRDFEKLSKELASRQQQRLAIKKWATTYRRTKAKATKKQRRRR